MNQRTMPFLGEARKATLAPIELVKNCRHRLDAIRLCVQLSSLPNEAVARELSIDKGHWTRMMQGQAHFPDAKSIELMNVCGNYAPMQFEALKTGFDLVEQSKDVRVRELEAELEQLRASA